MGLSLFTISCLLSIHVAKSQTTPDSITSKTLYGSVGESVEISLYFSVNTVEIKFNGPNEYFYGIGFNATDMNGTYAIIVVGNSGQIKERQLGLNAPGVQLKSSITVTSNTVTNGVRSVALQRDMTANDAQYYAFQPKVDQTLDIIYCYGTTAAVQYHGPARNTTTLSFNAPKKKMEYSK